MTLKHALDWLVEARTPCVIKDDVFDWHIDTAEFAAGVLAGSSPPDVRVGEVLIHNPS